MISDQSGNIFSYLQDFNDSQMLEVGQGQGLGTSGFDGCLALWNVGTFAHCLRIVSFALASHWELRLNTLTVFQDFLPPLLRAQAWEMHVQDVYGKE